MEELAWVFLSLDQTPYRAASAAQLIEAIGITTLPKIEEETTKDRLDKRAFPAWRDLSAGERGQWWEEGSFYEEPT